MTVAGVMMVLEYDGAGFHGWQKQRGLKTVQGELEEKLGLILREKVTLTGAGRTDAGCHASHQVASFNTGSAMALDTMARSINGLMRGDVVVRRIAPAPEGFNARFSAVSRAYRYLVALRATALLRNRVWVVERLLDDAAMKDGAAAIVGEHDFSGFSKVGERDRSNPVCRVRRAAWSAWDPGLAFEIEADRFLHGMVRMIVGTMIRIGTGRAPSLCVKEILDGRGACRGGPCAPARGLCLVHVSYGSTVDLGGDPAFTWTEALK